jgi:hypothetical protein
MLKKPNDPKEIQEDPIAPEPLWEKIEVWFWIALPIALLIIAMYFKFKH